MKGTSIRDSQTAARSAANVSAEAREIAIEASLHTYPLVVSQLTHCVSVGKPNSIPMNQFRHLRAIPDANFMDVVRSYADILFSTL